MSMMFLMVHFIVERWREALLWSWVVGKHGGLDDSWSEEQSAVAWQELGGPADDWVSLLPVKASPRDTLNSDRVSKNLKSSGLKQTDPTVYSFCTYFHSYLVLSLRPFLTFLSWEFSIARWLSLHRFYSNAEKLLAQVWAGRS